MSERIILEVSDELYDRMRATLRVPGADKRTVTKTFRDSLYAQYGVEPPVTSAKARAIKAKRERLAKLQAELEELEA